MRTAACHLRVDIQQALPILGGACQPFQLGQQDLSRRFMRQGLAQHREGARRLLQAALAQPGHLHCHRHLSQRIRRAGSLSRVDLDEILPQTVGFRSRLQSSQRGLVRPLPVGTPEQLESPARLLQHGLGRLGHGEEHVAALFHILGVA